MSCQGVGSQTIGRIGGSRPQANRGGGLGGEDEGQAGVK